jgi:ubiquinone/menaquinone biosynthesis C-methylase UbiE/DNA-binding transcriptional ArsR family regulator
MEKVLQGLRAAGEATRLRLLFVLSHGEFNVTELTQILLQSQPRISRHLKLMTDAGLLSRFKEGSWVVFRLRPDGEAGRLAEMIARALDCDDPVLRGDLARLNDVLAERAERAAAYFSANAANWDAVRSLHVDEREVEQAVLELIGDNRPEVMLDLGTGTGHMLRLLAGRAGQAIGVDSSREMLAVARASLEDAGLRDVQVRHGDIYALASGDASADEVVIHQVLHYLDQPGKAVAEAARVLKAGGRLLVVDFAPHELEFLREEHQHRRLGISKEAMAEWLAQAGLKLLEHRSLAPPEGAAGNGLTVSVWLAAKPALE